MSDATTWPTLRSVSGHTLVAGVVGDPIAHSLSPTLYNAAFAALGFDAVFAAFPVRTGEFAAALAGARALGLLGLSVTTPHKDAAARAADQRSDDVEFLGAANCIALSSGVSIAYSTDGEGLVDDLGRAVGFSPSGRRCAVLGAGGAARAVALALARADASDIVVVNRTPARARVAAMLAGPVGRVGELREAFDAELVVNATSIGLSADDRDLGASLAAPIRSGQLVVDLVYRPERTAFLDAAAARGATVRNGLGMLVHQAAHQLEHFTGLTAPIDAMWDAVRLEGPHAGSSRHAVWRHVIEERRG